RSGLAPYTVGQSSQTLLTCNQVNAPNIAFDLRVVRTLRGTVPDRLTVYASAYYVRNWVGTPPQAGQYLGVAATWIPGLGIWSIYNLPMFGMQALGPNGPVVRFQDIAVGECPPSFLPPPELAGVTIDNMAAVVAACVPNADTMNLWSIFHS